MARGVFMPAIGRPWVRRVQPLPIVVVAGRLPIARLTLAGGAGRNTEKAEKQLEVAMTYYDIIIYVEAGQPATLNDGAGKLTDCATLQEAVLAWHALPSAQKIRATVKVIGGPVYTAHQIDRLHYGPKPLAE